MKGSPPRMRGKDGYAVDPETGERITPAYAGKRPGAAGEKSTKPDHPRVCGEKCIEAIDEACTLGSPPRMRGKAFFHRHGGDELRITPAYAGKRIPCCRRSHLLWDHPRVCGEKLVNHCSALLNQGSPPRMRGKASALPLHLISTRITPAYAGKSW